MTPASPILPAHPSGATPVSARATIHSPLPLSLPPPFSHKFNQLQVMEDEQDSRATIPTTNHNPYEFYTLDMIMQSPLYNRQTRHSISHLVKIFRTSESYLGDNANVRQSMKKRKMRTMNHDHILDDIAGHLLLPPHYQGIRQDSHVSFKKISLVEHDEEQRVSEENAKDVDTYGYDGEEEEECRKRYDLRKRRRISLAEEQTQEMVDLPATPNNLISLEENDFKQNAVEEVECIKPVQIDDEASISFDDIGGLSEYIHSLKEMVFFPLLYPEFFAKYNINPPRGVLLCGPPGTGKTLIARALACAASKVGKQKVSFYMRKGADVLSKWIGEAEKQLRLLFEEARKNQPSIIFFDEIDGLAPVRSTSNNQDQNHNSIVSTLLALMDGLDSRGQIVLIGATNRVDAIDGALRRPGRFDREFNFPLPAYEARAQILDIHTRKWREPPSQDLKQELAATCVGYCGADIKALCSEAVIRAFRERYPQVYTTDDKLMIDVDSVKVEKHHFLEAISSITPAAHRDSFIHSRPLSPNFKPSLQGLLNEAMNIIYRIFPAANMTKHSMLSIIYRPRLLLCGDDDVVMDHVGPAVLHELEKFPLHSLALTSLLCDGGTKTPEQALKQVFLEARRNMPCVLYLPQFDLWWKIAHEHLKGVMLMLLKQVPSHLPILLLGTSSIPLDEISCDDATSIFSHHNVYNLSLPSIDIGATTL